MTNIIIAQPGAVVNVFDQKSPSTVTRNIAESDTFSNKLQKYEQKKLVALQIAEKLLKIGEKGRYFRMRDCSTELHFEVCPCCGKRVISGSNLCRDRLCPVCGWRLSLKRYADMVKTLKAFDTEKYDFFFLTLTVRNPHPEALATTLSEMARAWDRLMLRRPVRSAVAGWARSVEITYNREANTFHPHYHIILAFPRGLALDESYFRECWRQVARLDYEPQICLEPLRPKADTPEDTAICAAVIETYKYAVKDKQLIDMPLESFRALTYAIKGKRLAAFGGLIKSLRAELKITDDDEPDDSERVKVSPCCGAEMTKAVLRWSFEGAAYSRIMEAVV